MQCKDDGGKKQEYIEVSNKKFSVILRNYTIEITLKDECSSIIIKYI